MLSLVSISSQSVISFVKDAPEQVNRKKNPRDFPRGQPSSVVLKTVFHEEKFESQELCLFFDNGEYVFIACKPHLTGFWNSDARWLYSEYFNKKKNKNKKKQSTSLILHFIVLYLRRDIFIIITRF